MKKLALTFASVLAAVALVLHARAGTDRPAAPEAVRAAAAPSRLVADGRVVAYPGAEVVVGTDIAGTIRRLAVKEKDTVKKGGLLAELDTSEERAALLESKARLAEAEADVRLAAFELTRAEKLLSTRVGTQQAVDKAGRDRDAALARRATAAAEGERLGARIAKARITSPLDGTVLLRHAEEGETVERGARLVTVANLSRLRVEAEVDEADSGRVALGAPVTVRAEGDAEKVWRGRVGEIPDAVTGRRLKPQDPGRPSDTRVLLVKVALDGPAPLKLGRRVELSIEAR